jgi:hypothetical protein
LKLRNFTGVGHSPDHSGSFKITEKGWGMVGNVDKIGKVEAGRELAWAAAKNLAYPGQEFPRFTQNTIFAGLKNSAAFI